MAGARKWRPVQCLPAAKKRHRSDRGRAGTAGDWRSDPLRRRRHSALPPLSSVRGSLRQSPHVVRAKCRRDASRFRWPVDADEAGGSCRTCGPPPRSALRRAHKVLAKRACRSAFRTGSTGHHHRSFVGTDSAGQREHDDGTMGAHADILRPGRRPFGPVPLTFCCSFLEHSFAVPRRLRPPVAWHSTQRGRGTCPTPHRGIR